MNLTITRAALADALDTVGKTVPTRSTVPALSCVHIQALNNTLQLHTTDLEASTLAMTPVEGDEDGAALVPYRLLADLVRNVSAQKLTLATKDHALRITGSGVSATINGLDPADFPQPEDEDGAIPVAVNGAEFAQAVNIVLHAASRDASRPILNSVFVKVSAGTLTLATTDGYRLAVAQLDCTGDDISALVQPGILREAAQRLADEGEATFHLGERRAVFACGDVSYLAQLVDGKYPDYGAIIPKRSDITVTANRKELAQLVKTATLFTNKEKGKAVTLQVAESQLVVCAGHDGDSYSAEMEVEGGNDLQIVLNADYMSDVLSALPGQTVTVEFTQNTRPALWRGESEQAMCVTMPMHPPR